ncbi:MAG: hypothetical protein ABW007_17200 [Chitinophagaceae bacterium]
MARKNKRLVHLFGNMAKSMEPYYHQLDLRAVDELTDEAFAYIMPKVKGVNMLDLNEAEIGNESIELLTKLEYVKELRIKGCHSIDNGCIDALNKIKGLEFIHARYTGITIDGLLQLNGHPDLKTLMFSNDAQEDLGQKMLQLRALMPACEFVIDAKRYYFNEEPG